MMKDGGKGKGGSPSTKGGDVLQLHKVVGHCITNSRGMAVCDGCLVFPVGKVVVVHDWMRDANIRIIDVGHPVSCVCSHPSAPIIATGEDHPRPRISMWNIRTGALLAQLHRTCLRIAAVEFSLDGQHALAVGMDTTYVWNWRSGTSPSAVSEYKHPVNISEVAPLPGGGYIAVGGGGYVKVMGAGGKAARAKAPHRPSAFASSNFVAVGCVRSSIFLVADDSPILELDIARNVTSKWVYGLTSHDRGKGVMVSSAAIGTGFIAVGATDGKINVFNSASLAFMLKVPPPEGRHPVIAITIDDTTLHVVYSDKRMAAFRIDSTANTAAQVAVRVLHSSAVWGLKVVGSPPFLRAVTCSEDGRIQIWSLRGAVKKGDAGHDTPAVQGVLVSGGGAEGTAELRCLDSTQDGEWVVVGDKEGHIHTIRASGSSPPVVTASFVAHEKGVVAVCIDGKEGLVASAGEDGMVHVLHLPTPSGTDEKVHSLPNHIGAATCVRLVEGPDGEQIIVSGGIDGKLVFTPLHSDKAGEAVLQNTASPIVACDLHPRKTFVVTAGQTDTLSFHLVARPVGQPRRKYTVPSSEKGHHIVSIDPHANWVAVGSQDGKVRIIDYFTGRLVAESACMGIQPTSLAWLPADTPDKPQLLVGDAEGCLSLWRLSPRAASRVLEKGTAKTPLLPPTAGIPMPAPTGRRRVHRDPQASLHRTRSLGSKGQHLKGQPLPEGGQRALRGDEKPEQCSPSKDACLKKSGVLFTSSILRNNVEGRWHGAAYEAFVKNALIFPETDEGTDTASTTTDAQVLESEDEQDVVLSRRSMNAQQSIRSLMVSRPDDDKVDERHNPNSITSRWRSLHPTEYKLTSSGHVVPVDPERSAPIPPPSPPLPKTPQGSTPPPIKPLGNGGSRAHLGAPPPPPPPPAHKEEADDMEMEAIRSVLQKERDQWRKARAAENAGKAVPPSEVEVVVEQPLDEFGFPAGSPHLSPITSPLDASQAILPSQQPPPEHTSTRPHDQQPNDTTQRGAKEGLPLQQQTSQQPPQQPLQQPPQQPLQQPPQQPLQQPPQQPLQQPPQQQHTTQQPSQPPPQPSPQQPPQQPLQQPPPQPPPLEISQQNEPLQQPPQQPSPQQPPSLDHQLPYQSEQPACTPAAQPHHPLTTADQHNPNAKRTRPQPQLVDATRPRLGMPPRVSPLAPSPESSRGEKASSPETHDASLASLDLDASKLRMTSSSCVPSEAFPDELSSSANATGRTMAAQQSCRQGLEKIIDGLTQIYESLSLEGEPSVRGSAVSNTMTMSSAASLGSSIPPPERKAAFDEDLTSVLGWVKNNADGLLSTLTSQEWTRAASASASSGSSPARGAVHVDPAAIQEQIAEMEGRLSRRLAQELEALKQQLRDREAATD